MFEAAREPAIACCRGWEGRVEGSSMMGIAGSCDVFSVLDITEKQAKGRATQASLPRAGRVPDWRHRGTALLTA